VTDLRRILLDECMPAKLRREIPGYAVRAVREYGWASKLNGELLRAANAEFDVFVTVDRNLVHQQNLSGMRLAIVVLIAYRNSIQELRRLIPELLSVLATLQPGQVVQIGPPQDVHD
jgi:predicted nuclease of predicted toxin-antitoxin system